MNMNRLSHNTAGFQFRRKAVAFGVAMAIASPVYANPTGLSVVAGQATSQAIGNLMQITNTPGAILNWQQFNIDVGQTTQFIQQNAASQVFNRVTGGDVSQILGSLQSNGQVFLINPAGVFFGQSAVIDTAGFLASTLAASDTDLLNGHLRFKDANGNAGSIVNQGKLTTHSGGSIVLLAPSIENSGVIHADGEVLLAAGHSVTIVDLKHPTIGLTVVVKDGEQAVNLGQIVSKNASVFSHLVKNSGIVEATGAQVRKGGVIRFVAQGDAIAGGQIKADSADGKGGEIDITGKRVAVLSGAHISADGATGGGTVHVGGGWKGQDESIANSKQTVVQANTLISANATQNGDGGEVVVWADGSTVVNSEVQAKGGAQSGNGGRVETSGKQALAVNVAANTSAPKGQSGLWLIDPANLTIVDEIPSGENNLDNTSSGPVFSTDDISASFSPTDSFLLASTVVSGLESNGSVEIYTSGTQSGDGNLTIDAAVLIDQNLGQISFNPRLLLEAKGSININAEVGLMPGQTAFDGFDLVMSYDIAKPVYIDAPLYLGNNGNLTLAPYQVPEGSQLPINTPGELPLDGVNFLSGMNIEGSSEPLVLNRINVSTAVATDPFGQGQEPLFVDPANPVKLNVLGANLKVNHINAFETLTSPASEVRVGLDNRVSLAPVQGQLSYNIMEAKSLIVDAGSSVSTFTRVIPNGNPAEISPSTFLDKLQTRGTVALNGGFSSITDVLVDAGTVTFGNNAEVALVSSNSHLVQNITAESGSTINLDGANMQYGHASLNGTFNVMAANNGGGFFLDGVDTDLNGSINISSGSNFVYLQSLGMTAGSEIQVGSGSMLALGRAFSSSLGPVDVTPKLEGGMLSSTNGQFVAQQGARIVLNGAASPLASNPPPIQAAQSVTVPVFGGARLDVTGLDGRLDAPIIIESNGFANAISTFSENSDFRSESGFTPIETLVIQAADIRVNSGGEGQALRIGEFVSSISPGPESGGSGFGSLPTVDLDFNGTLTVNSGTARLEGAAVSTTGGNLTVNGPNSQITLAGRFTTADLQVVNRTMGGRLGAEGFWDNSAVNSGNVATASPLSKGDITIGDDLTIAGGLLSSAGTSNALKVTPDGFLLLRSSTGEAPSILEVTSTIDLAPTAALMIGAQDENGIATAPVVLNKTNINMGGDSFLLVESDSEGVANLNGTANINSGHQGNLILAGRRVFDSNSVSVAPDAMTLNVGTGIRLNVTGNTPSLPPGLALDYSQQQITAPNRPVFLVGQLTPEAVAIAEYDDFGGFSTPLTTVLSGFQNPSFVVDGSPDSSNPNAVNCVVNDFCVKFDVAQTLTFSGMVMSSLGAPEPTLANSGVGFVAGANLTGLQFAVTTPDEIVFMQGVNNVTVADLVSGKRLVNSQGSTVRLGMNVVNETIANDLQNNGELELQGNYTLSGLLSGTGTLNNSGTLVLSNGTGSLITNAIVNSGSLSNSGDYTFGGVLSGTGNFTNNGTFNLTGSGLFQNAIANGGTGVLNFNGQNQNIQFAGAFSNSSNVLFNGGVFTFNALGFNQTGGNLTVQPGTTLTGNVNINGGALRGFANINGNLNAQGGQIMPGASPGLMTVTGNLELNANSVLDIEIQGNGGTPGVDFDCIVVGGSANLDGQLNLIDISNGSLAPGSQYAFLQANAINGSFGSVSYSPASSSYAFTPPVVTPVSTMQQMSTSTFALNPPPPVEPTPLPDSAIIQTTGDADSAVGQNLNQAFTPPPNNTEPGSTAPTPTAQQQAQQEEEAVEVANQSAAGTTISQQSNDIELKTTQSDPQRASAVCK